MVSIHDRPAEVESRRVPGHWEGDLVKGTNQKAAIGTLVERTTRLTLLVKLDGLTADDACRAFAKKLRRVPAVFRKSLTYDRGKEMTDHERLAKQLKINVYFADPRSPWQRATCENTNGLIRQYFPRGTDLVPVTQRDLNFVARRLNTRPRQGLGGMTPYEAWDKLCRSVAVGT
jgi:IS30 family transposase